jgi:hypothetical protein
MVHHGAEWPTIVRPACPETFPTLPFLQRHQTHCQLEAHIHYSKLVSHAPEGEWAKMAPFRILSLDIECQGRKVRHCCPRLCVL